MPDLSILILLAEFYDVEIKEILDGERRKGTVEKEMKETLSKVADYSRMEKEKAAKAGSMAFSLMFLRGGDRDPADHFGEPAGCSGGERGAAFGRDRLYRAHGV